MAGFALFIFHDASGKRFEVIIFEEKLGLKSTNHVKYLSYEWRREQGKMLLIVPFIVTKLNLLNFL